MPTEGEANEDAVGGARRSDAAESLSHCVAVYASNEADQRVGAQRDEHEIEIDYPVVSMVSSSGKR